jgi:tRNA G26 N,N-dimethylase Trm1
MAWARFNGPLRRFPASRGQCYRERGVRLLLAEAARAAGRYDRGIVPVWAVSAEHYVLASVRVVRGARGADASMGRVLGAGDAASPHCHSLTRYAIVAYRDPPSR